MEEKLTPAEAWADFFEWIQDEERWSKLTHKERSRLIIADRDSRGVRKRVSGTVYSLGVERMEKILNDFAPGRYRFERHTDIFLTK